MPKGGLDMKPNKPLTQTGKDANLNKGSTVGGTAGSAGTAGGFNRPGAGVGGAINKPQQPTTGGTANKTGWNQPTNQGGLKQPLDKNIHKDKDKR
jgi:hypothetical protein